MGRRCGMSVVVVFSLMTHCRHLNVLVIGGVAMPITEREREIAEALGPTLAARGLLLVGLDVIGGCLTEVNVTSPTCFQEITQQMGFDVAAMFIDALERAL